MTPRTPHAALPPRFYAITPTFYSYSFPRSFFVLALKCFYSIRIQESFISHCFHCPKFASTCSLFLRDSFRSSRIMCVHVEALLYVRVCSVAATRDHTSSSPVTPHTSEEIPSTFEWIHTLPGRSVPLQPPPTPPSSTTLLLYLLLSTLAPRPPFNNYPFTAPPSRHHSTSHGTYITALYSFHVKKSARFV